MKAKPLGENRAARARRKAEEHSARRERQTSVLAQRLAREAPPSPGRPLPISADDPTMGSYRSSVSMDIVGRGIFVLQADARFDLATLQRFLAELAVVAGSMGEAETVYRRTLLMGSTREAAQGVGIETLRNEVARRGDERAEAARALAVREASDGWV